MNKYISEVYKSKIIENKGYIYITTEYIYFPIYKVELEITKRKETKLNLVEEFILKLISNEITNIDELSSILGIDKSMLNITIADLSLKNLVYHTSNKCIIMSKGMEALKEVKLAQKETDKIKNVYVDPISKNIIDIKGRLLTNQPGSKSKLISNFNGQDLEFYRRNVSKIKKIFEEEIVRTYSDENLLPDELVSIDYVNDVNIKYFRIPIQIYISDGSLDFDIVSSDKKYSDILDSNKEYILEEIRSHRIFSDIIRLKKPELCKYKYSNLVIDDKLYDLMDTYYLDKDNKDRYYSEIRDSINKDREFYENEFIPLFYYILQGAKSIDFYISNLDEWSKDSKFIEILTKVSSSYEYNVVFNSTWNESISKKRISRSIKNIDYKNFKHKNHNHYLRIDIDNKYSIVVSGEIYNIMNTESWIIKRKYYLKKL
ncbi:UNVERIFIED_CONTAM: hypothetical protein C3P01_01400 [Clostridioides difficile]|uniref:hypothetical protein n=1 Tax=Clostridioides difficile TaxID=1496 RepID=UPI00038D7FC4|nr:hypothetical protein [Clostridioides difficile]EQE83469.1 hypothetical protein QCW_3250 [Clostridioides difficile CD69]OYO89355.1 hypothetical protein B7359_07120 [Clostridioides difficile]HBE9726391.1 hypothetical protein [Clostridioides difficile]HBF7936515.1 hypothetical protein [Clostridioides difficile]HBG6489820.1 hypothetical protein [Clostridioides difficile]